MEAQSLPVNFLPIVFQIVVALGFVFTTMFVTHKIGPKRVTSDKLTPFESGIEVIGNARTPVSIKYFLVAILFVLFDVEVIFMYPWAVNFRDLGKTGMIEMFIFRRRFWPVSSTLLRNVPLNGIKFRLILNTSATPAIHFKNVIYF